MEFLIRDHIIQYMEENIFLTQTNMYFARGDHALHSYLSYLINGVTLLIKDIF